VNRFSLPSSPTANTFTVTTPAPPAFHETFTCLGGSQTRNVFGTTLNVTPEAASDVGGVDSPLGDGPKSQPSSNNIAMAASMLSACMCFMILVNLKKAFSPRGPTLVNNYISEEGNSRCKATITAPSLSRYRHNGVKSKQKFNSN